MDENRAFAKKFGIPILEEIGEFSLVKKQTAIIPYLLAKQKQLIPIEEDEEGVTVAVADPLQLESAASVLPKDRG